MEDGGIFLYRYLLKLISILPRFKILEIIRKGITFVIACQQEKLN